MLFDISIPWVGKLCGKLLCLQHALSMTVKQSAKSCVKKLGWFNDVKVCNQLRRHEVLGMLDYVFILDNNVNTVLTGWTPLPFCILCTTECTRILPTGGTPVLSVGIFAFLILALKCFQSDEFQSSPLA